MERSESEIIIEQLQRLQITQTELLTRLQSIQTNRPESPDEKPDLRPVPPARSSPTTSRPKFNIGDEVTIINTIRKPAAATQGWTLGKEQRAIVQSVQDQNGKVYITTLNGTKTYRIAKHLRHGHQYNSTSSTNLR